MNLSGGLLVVIVPEIEITEYLIFDSTVTTYMAR